MKQLTFFNGLCMAILLTVAGAAVSTVTAPLLGSGLAMRALVLLLGGAYLLWLLHVTRVDFGISLMAAAWLLVTGLLLLFNPPISLWLGAQTVLIWLIRCAARYDRLWPPLLDAGLNLLALCCGISAFWHTGSMAMAIWSFFLLQALCMFIPGRQPRSSHYASDDTRPFDQSRYSAEQALRRLRRSSSV